jgi:hypothetical protein
MVAGTVLVLEEADTTRALARLGEAMRRSALPPETVRLIQDLLDRWRDLEQEQRTKLARGLLAKLDPQFQPSPESVPSESALRDRLEALVGGPT